ncbi:MAG: hypothetical protein OHK0048_24990 [Rhodoferax sp.]
MDGAGLGSKGLSVGSEDEYEDLLALWADLESSLAITLGYPYSVQEFEARVLQYDRWMRDLLALDTDVGLYLLFQLATRSPVGYSTSHALVCAVLCHLLSQEFALPTHERDSLVCAALTMNLAMTRLQDELAVQIDKPNARQRATIESHARNGAQMLRDMGIVNPLWLEVIAHHHDDNPGRAPLSDMAPGQRLAHVLNVVDRYAAMISPRQSRAGRSSMESAQALLRQAQHQASGVAQALVRIVGFCPPGTYVRLDDAEVAVVTRRSAQPNAPDVAIVLDASGQALRPPCLHRTSRGKPQIEAALEAAAVQERINHHLVLQLAASA